MTHLINRAPLGLLVLATLLAKVVAQDDALPYEVNSLVQADQRLVEFQECFPVPGRTHSLADFDAGQNGGQKYATVIATYYTGCGPGRGESPTFSAYADDYAELAAAGDPEAPRAAFLASLKVGVNNQVCSSWATLEGQVSDHLFFIDDADRSLQYIFFNNDHPMYVVLDHCLRVRAYLVQGEMELGLKPILDTLLTEAADPSTPTCPDPSGSVTSTTSPPSPPAPELQPPPAPPSPSLGPICVPQFGELPAVLTVSPASLPDGSVAPGGLPFLAMPRGLAFNPINGDLWVINNHTQSVTVLSGLQSTVQAYAATQVELQTEAAKRLFVEYDVMINKVVEAEVLQTGGVTLANRRDRGYYHYMSRGSSISFDQKGYFATCQESENNYDFHDDPNFFMGPTLYDSSEQLLKQADGQPCLHDDRQPGSEPCFVAHIDMLHESPVCVGIAHDPETTTPWGNVYWAIGARYEPTSEEYDSTALTLLRYDFEKPHGIGVLDHSLANVRRYHEVEIRRRPGVPSHLAVDPYTSTIYVSDTGNNRILAVDRSTGSFDRHARLDQGGEFLLWSATEPAFEYSVYHCVAQEVFANVSSPSGLVVTEHFVFVAEYDSGHILTLRKGTRELVGSVDTGAAGLMGLALEPTTGKLWFVNGLTNEIGHVHPAVPCPDTSAPLTTPPEVQYPEVVCGPAGNLTLGEVIDHVPHDCGYQNQTDMCLGEQYGISRDSCTGPGSYNLDMLLMTGHFCHHCLPDPCLNGGHCENIWNQGYLCVCPQGFNGTHCQYEYEYDVDVTEEVVSVSSADNVTDASNSTNNVTTTSSAPCVGPGCLLFRSAIAAGLLASATALMAVADGYF